jgi:hypothetical protein
MVAGARSIRQEEAHREIGAMNNQSDVTPLR